MYAFRRRSLVWGASISSLVRIGHGRTLTACLFALLLVDLPSAAGQDANPFPTHPPISYVGSGGVESKELIAHDLELITQDFSGLQGATANSSGSVPATTTTQPANGPTVEFGLNGTDLRLLNLNLRWGDDQFPTDIADDRGVFIISSDRTKILRIYGSLRMRVNWEDREVASPWAMDYILLPTGADDRVNHQFEFNARGSRVGLDAGVKDLGAIRMEFDFRGTADELRRRHMFLRLRHWIIGKNWTAFNTIPYIPLSLDYHSVGAHAGFRTAQIKYVNGIDLAGPGYWEFHIALEDNKPRISAPDAVEANAKNVIPHLTGHITRGGDWGEARIAGLVAPNRVRFIDGTRYDLGWGMQSGIRLHVNDANVIKAHVIGLSGQSSLMADFTPGATDMVYDPVQNDFRNLLTLGASLALEHSWGCGLSTTIGGSFIDFDLPDFADDQFLDQGYKALVNLIWRPKQDRDGVTMGVEWVYANRTDKDGRSTQANRLILASWYDF